MHDVSSGHHTVFSKHCLKWFKVGANSTLPEKYGRGLCCKCKQFIRGVKQSDKRNAKLSEEVWRRKLYMSRMLDERSKERLESYDGEEGDDQHEEQTGGIDGDGRREAGMDDTGI
ncbi:Hypp3080 [Branchiostoma lanceolatum]|uniref:Hypp3080 protein n=1 Tax=Branchiostoma lanceolatum TaxID=7740 RepID=A0A8J9ZYZ4_BRALA|nr:Hypp3080 [Branchiostoma lanceolatum]